jgi:hypothetical protein
MEAVALQMPSTVKMTVPYAFARENILKLEVNLKNCPSLKLEFRTHLIQI